MEDSGEPRVAKALKCLGLVREKAGRVLVKRDVSGGAVGKVPNGLGGGAKDLVPQLPVRWGRGCRYG